MRHLNRFNENVNSNKFPITSDGRMGLNLEFKYKNRVYTIDTNSRLVKTEQYYGLEVSIPKNIKLPNIHTIEDGISGKDFNTRLVNLERLLEVDNDRYKELQDYISSINWEMEKEKRSLKNKMMLFIEDYGDGELRKIINDLNIPLG